MEISYFDKLVGLIEKAVKFNCPTVNEENAVITRVMGFLDVDRMSSVSSRILEENSPLARHLSLNLE